MVDERSYISQIRRQARIVAQLVKRRDDGSPELARAKELLIAFCLQWAVQFPHPAAGVDNATTPAQTSRGPVDRPA